MAVTAQGEPRPLRRANESLLRPPIRHPHPKAAHLHRACRRAVAAVQQVIYNSLYRLLAAVWQVIYSALYRLFLAVWPGSYLLRSGVRLRWSVTIHTSSPMSSESRRSPSRSCRNRQSYTSRCSRYTLTKGKSAHWGANLLAPP